MHTFFSSFLYFIGYPKGKLYFVIYWSVGDFKFELVFQVDPVKLTDIFVITVAGRMGHKGMNTFSLLCRSYYANGRNLSETFGSFTCRLVNMYRPSEGICLVKVPWHRAGM